MSAKHHDFGSTMPDLNSFFSPKSIAVIGASERDTSMGGLVLQNLKSSSFEYPVVAVNLKGYQSVFGFPCVKYLRETQQPIDLGIICVPPEVIPRILRQMGRLGIKAGLILTGGLARQLNFSPENNRKIAKIAKEQGVRLMGPNCLGILVPEHHMNASYTHIDALPGSAAYVGHSAALGGALLDWAGARGIGFSHFLTLGASADIRISDVVDYLASDRRVKAILIHLEQIRDANRLLTALRAASRSKRSLPSGLILKMRHRMAFPTSEKLITSFLLEPVCFRLILSMGSSMVSKYYRDHGLCILGIWPLSVMDWVQPC